MAKKTTPLKRDRFTKRWITENAIEIVARYEHGILTLRALHYQLVGRGMTNTLQHYKRVVNAMIDARWAGKVSFDQFSDHDRGMLGDTRYATVDLDSSISEAKSQINAWMRYYSRNRWENQPFAPEVWIEKKALQGVFSDPCRRMNVALAPCKGYPSLTFLNEATKRFSSYIESGRKPIILYFGDYDASGEDIPRSIGENFNSFGYDIEIRCIALTHKQVIELKLPPAPTKEGDSRAKNWDGIGQVELDAVEFNLLQSMCSNAINDIFDQDLYAELMSTQESEEVTYRSELKMYVQSL